MLASREDSAQEKAKKFIKEYSETVGGLPGVTKVEFTGSIANGSFRPGESDIDVFVHGDRLAKETRKEAIFLVRKLSSKHQLGLERAPCQHETPFFIDGFIRRRLYVMLKGRSFLWFRKIFKMLAPSYGLVWKLRPLK